MANKVSMSIVTQECIPSVDPKTGELYLVDGDSREIRNPFHNLLDMVKQYLHIWESGDIEALSDFAAPSGSGDKAQLISQVDMFDFVLSMFWNSIYPEKDDEWMDFDHEELDMLLKNSFFDEYFQTKGAVSCRREYPMLDVYSFVRLQACATTVLPGDKLWDINYIWVFEDFIEQIYMLKWFDTISIVYKARGIHWFANNGENDPVMYKWACYAVAACRKNQTVSEAELKRDLTDIYKELLIAFTIRGTLEKNKDIIEYVQECIMYFDEERIHNLVNHVHSLEREKEQLVDEKKQLNQGIEMLRTQLKELQEDEEKSDGDKVEEMAYRIYCLSPQNEKMEDKVAGFRTVWDKLDKSTKKDIKLSISMFENFESFDLAVFPMIRSLEHEFARNFFIPFQYSRQYKDAGVPQCKNRYYEKTHDALVKKGSTYPTMGSIPFIGKAMMDVKAQEASNLVKAFRIFLGDNRAAFVSICKALDTYKLGARQYKLVEIRNGIAHGNDEVTSQIDRRCYEEVSKLLYEPPIQILFEVVYHSMRK